MPPVFLYAGNETFISGQRWTYCVAGECGETKGGSANGIEANKHDTV